MLSREGLPADAAFEQFDTAVRACVSQQGVPASEALSTVFTLVELRAVAVDLHVKLQVVASGELLTAYVTGIHTIVPQ